ncbi:MAG: DUF1566 domain-containing protein [Leptospirales bacterium]|nr:DUF1566 domain-containing protein [Leptospirales bacterium]
MFDPLSHLGQRARLQIIGLLLVQTKGRPEFVQVSVKKTKKENQSMKRKVLLIALLAGFTFSISGCSQDTGKKYKIGQPGPAGGLVFYDKGSFSDGWQYLEAAPASTNIREADWGADLTDVPGTKLHVGDGKKNTEIIVKRLNELGEKGHAAQLCAELKFGGFSDWFLPSRDELSLMYDNLHKKGLGDFGDLYWSSSQANSYAVWHKHFSNGFQHSDDKDKSRSGVRAIRAF